ncbi:hypothetical protein [Luteibacter sp.]|jgi:transposase InsO family protein|uniref:hypothetical protein n=1 Tax=Luteibacter sp. TaxID=1886636 RepID=UPI002F424D40
MDFVGGALFDGWRFRLMTAADQFTQERPNLAVDQLFHGEHVAEAMTRLIAKRGKPTAVKVDIQANALPRLRNNPVVNTDPFVAFPEFDYNDYSAR